MHYLCYSHLGYTSVYHGDPEVVETSKAKWFCSSCCNSHPSRIQSDVHAVGSLRTGPLNRQDIFYSGSLIRMSSYNNDMKVRPDLQIEKQKVTKNTFRCRASIKLLTKLLRMLIDVSLLKSTTYGVISLGLFLYLVGLFTPYMYLSSKSIVK